VLSAGGGLRVQAEFESQRNVLYDFGEHRQTLTVFWSVEASTIGMALDPTRS